MELTEFFAGIGAFRQGLINQNIDFRTSGISEYDKYAIKSYNAMFGETENFGDITKIKSVPKSDFWTYGFPCQDISIAGNQKGIKEGTRSGLLLEFERILESVVVSNEQPKMLLMENVKNLVGKRHKPDFDGWLKKLDDLGYNSYYQVLNTKNYGLPQNRERVFCLSIKKEIDKKGFDFPKKQELKLRLKDILEDKVSEKYYLKKEQCENLIRNKKLGQKILESEINQIGMLDIKGNRQAKVLIKNATKKGYLEAFNGDGIDLAYPDSKTRRGRVQPQRSHTLTTSDNLGVLTDFRIRKLLPIEVWRLQGFSDEQFAKAEEVCSNTRLYKQAGNTISVNVLEAIYKQMVKFGYLKKLEV